MGILWSSQRVQATTTFIRPFSDPDQSVGRFVNQRYYKELTKDSTITLHTSYTNTYEHEHSNYKQSYSAFLSQGTHYKHQNNRHEQQECTYGSHCSVATVLSENKLLKDCTLHAHCTKDLCNFVLGCFLDWKQEALKEN